MRQTDKDKDYNPRHDDLNMYDRAGCAMMLAAAIIVAALLALAAFRLITLIL